MNSDIHNPLRNMAPSKLDWVMLAFSLLTLACIILTG
jgi:hypothetical protein